MSTLIQKKRQIILCTQCLISFEQYRERWHCEATIIDIYPEKDKKTWNKLKISFSNFNKHPKLQIDECGLVVKDNSYGSKKFIICDPVIPDEGIHEFTFQINENGAAYIGICILDRIDFELLNLNIWSNNHHGQNRIPNRISAYLLCNDGFAFSSDSQEENNVETHFKFQKNDKITISVNQITKTIKWQKFGTTEIIVQHFIEYEQSMRFKNNKNLHPFLMIEGQQITIIE